MEYIYKIVDFDEYCPKCAHVASKDDDEPCYSCLAVAVREYSHKPENFLEKKGAGGDRNG